MTERRIGFEERVAAKASTDLESLSLQEKIAVSLGRLKAQRGTTNKDLAEKLGVSEAYISQVTRAMRDLKVSTLDKMTREWDVPIEELITVTKDDLERIAASHSRRRKKKSAATVTP
ncbi:MULTISPECIES: helix-turn-helix domain-containing protein [Rhizobium/Agrobacterium group]|uniref:helix-turn-helix domain-containing protein n=1 Tax=Rhizobium/Agrobacterium group TaxID=227290 RepID=UPI0020C77558|nr:MULTISPECIES: helix-turn-helix transcriptional regulator [Rhizobium/Agrobacterium group]